MGAEEKLRLRIAIGAGNKGKVRTDEMRSHISQAKKAVSQGPHSEKTKQLIGVKAKSRWADAQFHAGMCAVFKTLANVRGIKFPKIAGVRSKEALRIKKLSGVMAQEEFYNRSRAMKSRVITKEWREHMSIAQAKRVIREGGYHPEEQWRHKKPKTGYFFSEKCQKRVFFGSSLEEIALHLLEVMQGVASFSRCPFRVPYENEQGIVHNYVPDILVEYIDGSQEVIEVKANYMVSYPPNPAKVLAAKLFFESKGIRYSIWTERELEIA
jgi:hypothetical protein